MCHHDVLLLLAFHGEASQDWETRRLGSLNLTYLLKGRAVDQRLELLVIQGISALSVNIYGVAAAAVGLF